MPDISKKTIDPFERNSGFDRALKLINAINNNTDPKNINRRKILSRYTLLGAGFGVLQQKAENIDLKRKGGFLKRLFSKKANSSRVETAIPNIVATIDIIIEWERWMANKNVPLKTKKYIRKMLDKGVIDLTIKPTFRTKTYNMLVTVGVGLFVMSCAAFATAAFASIVGLTGGTALAVVAIATGCGFLAKYPLDTAVRELLYQMSPKTTKLFHGFAEYKSVVLVDLIKSLKKIDLNDREVVANAMVTHSSRPIKLHKSNDMQKIFESEINNSPKVSHHGKMDPSKASQIQSLGEAINNNKKPVLGIHTSNSRNHASSYKSASTYHPVRH